MLKAELPFATRWAKPHRLADHCPLLQLVRNELPKIAKIGR